MHRFFIAALGALLAVSVGCQGDNKHDHMHHDGDAMNASADVCPHCAGVQKANADGKCPMCGAKASPSTMMSSMDACDHCPGVQTATADGKCPACDAMLKK